MVGEIEYWSLMVVVDFSDKNQRVGLITKKHYTNHKGLIIDYEYYRDGGIEENEIIFGPELFATQNDKLSKFKSDINHMKNWLYNVFMLYVPTSVLQEYHPKSDLAKIWSLQFSRGERIMVVVEFSDGRTDVGLVTALRAEHENAKGASISYQVSYQVGSEEEKTITFNLFKKPGYYPDRRDENALDNLMFNILNLKIFLERNE